MNDDLTQDYYLINYANSLSGASWEAIFKSGKYQLVKDSRGFPLLLTKEQAATCWKRTPKFHLDVSEYSGRPNLESLYYGSLMLCPFEVILKYYCTYPPRPLGRQKTTKSCKDQLNQPTTPD